MKLDSKGALFAGAVLAGTTILMAACVSHPTEQVMACIKVPQTGGDQDVKITFDAKGCPISVDQDGFEVGRTKRIVWQSVGPGDTTPGYEIYFDPFKGGPLQSDKSGNRKSNPFDSCSPAGEYKYTIVGNNCKGEPLDPRFRLR